MESKVHQQEMRPLFFCGWPLNFPIRDGVFYHIPYNLGTPVFTVYKHVDIAEWHTEHHPIIVNSILNLKIVYFSM